MTATHGLGRATSRDQGAPASVLSSVAAGGVIGTSMILWSFTLAALIFKGELAPHAGHGAGFILAGCIVLGLVLSWRSTHPGAIGAPDEAAGVILALAASTLVTKVGIDQPETLYATVLATVMTATVASALVFFALGHFRLGNLVRFIPHPVIGGVVVTMGWLLVVGALTVMTDLDLAPGNLSSLLNAQVAAKWMPGIALALLLLVVMRRTRHFLVLPGILVTAIVLFYLVTLGIGMDIDVLRADGWLLGPFEGTSLATLPDPGLLLAADWQRIGEVAPDLGILVLLCVLSLLLSATALEVAVDGDVDLNHELKLCGLANLLCAPCGGVTGSHSLEDSLIAREMGAARRLTGLVSAAVCTLALFFGAELLAFLPKPLIGGFILFFGLVLLVEWIYEGWFRLPRADYLVVVLCLAVSLTTGYLEAIVVGLAAGVVIFVVDYSRVSVVRQVLSGAQYRSNVERHRAARDALIRDGDRIMILKLQGYIFFGTAHRIYQRIARRQADATRPPLAFVLLDFTAVPGADVSAVASFSKIRQLAERAGFQVVITHLADDIAQRFRQSGVRLGGSTAIQRVDDFDRALEWCEDGLLAELGIDPEGDASGHRRIADWLPDPNMLPALLPYLEARDVSSGNYLIRQGDPSTDLFLIETGRVAIQLESPGHPAVRLRSMGPGTVVGEVALYLGQPRSASVVAEVPSRVYRLTRRAMERMKREDTALAAAFNESVVHLLATRLVDTNRMLAAVMR